MTELQIYNKALIRLGQEPLDAIDEDSRLGDLVRGQYEHSLLEMLYDTVLDHNWKFAVKRIQLNADINTPLFDYVTQYKKPADCLKVINIGVRGDDFVEEGDFILTNLADTEVLNLRYLANVSDTTKFTPFFTKSLYLHIALELCQTVTQDKNLFQLIEAEFKEVKHRAVAREAYSAQPDQFYYNDSLGIRL